MIRNFQRACNLTPLFYAAVRCWSASQIRFPSNAWFEGTWPDPVGRNIRNQEPFAVSLYPGASNKLLDWPNRSSPRPPRRNPDTMKIFRGSDAARYWEPTMPLLCGNAVFLFTGKAALMPLAAE